MCTLQTQDFDPHSLRLVLPAAVSHIHSALRSGGKAYVHCTAGLGRAPAACIAYLYWFSGMDLPEVHTLALEVIWDMIHAR